MKDIIKLTLRKFHHNRCWNSWENNEKLLNDLYAFVFKEKGCQMEICCTFWQSISCFLEDESTSNWFNRMTDTKPYTKLVFI